MDTTANLSAENLLGELPANTQRNQHVIITSERRFDVIIMCLSRLVIAGLISMESYVKDQSVIDVMQIYQPSVLLELDYCVASLLASQSQVCQFRISYYVNIWTVTCSVLDETHN